MMWSWIWNLLGVRPSVASVRFRVENHIIVIGFPGAADVQGVSTTSRARGLHHRRDGLRKLATNSGDEIIQNLRRRPGMGTPAVRINKTVRSSGC